MTNKERKQNTERFPPGSRAALDAGCRCPVLDNAHGKGYMGGALYLGEVQYVYSFDCPIHGLKEEKA